MPDSTSRKTAGPGKAGQRAGTADRAADEAADTAEAAAAAKPPVPGSSTGGAPVGLEVPAEPRGPLPPDADQAGPASVSRTGQRTRVTSAGRAQGGACLTTAQGLRLPDSDHSLKAGPRGPVLLRDHLREKITHFDHERIPERVVHARGAPAHGIFRGYGAAPAAARQADRRLDDLPEALTAAGCVPTAPGIVSGKSAQTVLKGVIKLLGTHRVWDRFPATTAA